MIYRAVNNLLDYGVKDETYVDLAHSHRGEAYCHVLVTYKRWQSQHLLEKDVL